MNVKTSTTKIERTDQATVALRAAADKFISSPKIWAATQDFADRDVFDAAQKDPKRFFSSRGLRLPQGLDIELFGHPSKYLPPPDWFPFFIELYNCRTYFVRRCDESSPPRCEWKEETLCFGIRIRPRFLPPIA